MRPRRLTVKRSETIFVPTQSLSVAGTRNESRVGDEHGDS
jgi:hypothetical protein